MKRALALLVACGASVFLTQPGFAARDAWGDKEATGINYAYADCVVKQQHGLAARAILGNVGNDEIVHHYSGLIIPDCLVEAAHGGAEMSFGGDLYRYALAGALVRKDLADRTLDDLDQVAPLDHLAVSRDAALDSGDKLAKSKQAKLTKSYQNSLATRFLSAYGECIVRADPAGAKAVLFSKPQKPDEAAAFKALMPALQNCMPAGSTLSFGPLPLRGALAINYFRLAYAPRVAAPTKTVN
jgi:hypothetical protein